MYQMVSIECQYRWYGGIQRAGVTLEVVNVAARQ